MRVERTDDEQAHGQAPKKPGIHFHLHESEAWPGGGWSSTLSYQKKVVVVLGDPIYAGIVIAPKPLRAEILRAGVIMMISHRPPC